MRSSRTATLKRALPTLGVGAVLALPALVLGPWKHDPVDWLGLCLLYALLMTAAHGALVGALAFGWIPGVAVGLLIGLAVSLQLHEVTDVFTASWQSIGLGIAIGIPYALSVRLAGGPVPRGRGWRSCAAATAGFVAATAVVFYASPVLRWHVLDHHPVLGIAAYYLFGRPVSEERAALYARHELVEPGSVAVRRTAVGGGPRAPNVVLILVDTLRADSLSDYGGEPALMPGTNRIADRSVVFTNVLSNASWTRAAVASLFTGLRTEEHGTLTKRNALSTEWTTLAELLSQAGYETAAFVANHANVNVALGFGQGFQTFVPVKEDGQVYASAETVRATVERWLAQGRQVAGDGELPPAFLYIQYLDPHRPYRHGGDERTIANARRGYEHELAYLDAELVRMFALLEDALPGRTEIVLTSDHGEEFGEHRGRGHGKTLYHEVLSIPAFLYSGGERRGRIAARLEIRDLFDLVASLASPEEIDLRSWAAAHDRTRRYVSLYQDRRLDPIRPYWKTTALRGVEEGDLMLVWDAYGGTLELYDEARDPGQTQNLERERTDDVRRLYGALDDGVRFWARPQAEAGVSQETQEMLKALGYAR